MRAESLVDLVKRLAADSMPAQPIAAVGSLRRLATGGCGDSQTGFGKSSPPRLFSLNSLISQPSAEPVATHVPEWIKERTAILDHERYARPEWAAALARLNPERPPVDVPRKRWLIFLDDCGRFNEQWAGRAVALGWRAHDLFGCDRLRPLARLDNAGLLWLLEGREIVLLTGDTAVIGGRCDARLTYRREPSYGQRRVLAWELVE